MTVDYDLVVVGATAVAQVAALTAAQAHAHTAWVTETAPECSPLFLLRESSCLLQSQPLTAQGLRTEVELLESVFTERSAPAVAQAAGVHYLEGSISFQSEGLTVDGKAVRSRSYLLTMEPTPVLLPIPGIIHPRVWTIPQLLQRLQSSEQEWPQTIGILGAGPHAVELSQSMQRLGLSVVLITGGGPLLPQEDLEAAFLLQTYLEGSGVKVYTQDPLLAVQASPEGLCLEIGNRQAVVNALVTAAESAGKLPETFTALNLRQTPNGLWVSPSLQTSRPAVYACGGLLGGYRIPSVEHYEAKIAVRNALFAKQMPVQYDHVPYAILSNPPLARVGLTEAQATRYDAEVQVIRQTYRSVDRAILTLAPAGLFKILVQPDGTILGAHLVGEDAPELIHLFALAIQQGIRLGELAQGGFVSSTFAQVVQHVIEAWQRQQSQKNRDRDERWFYRQRRKAH